MGTRAAFFIGDPTDLEGRKYIGSFDWDGDSGAVLEDLGTPKTEAAYIDVLRNQVISRDDWHPADKGFPYPWANDLFLTDYVYAFFDGKLQFTGGWEPWKELSEEGIKSADEDADGADEDIGGRLPQFTNVPAVGNYNGSLGGIILIAM